MKTRWNSTFNTLERALQPHHAIKEWLDAEYDETPSTTQRLFRGSMLERRKSETGSKRH